jgi:hypothetical protein
MSSEFVYRALSDMAKTFIPKTMQFSRPIEDGRGVFGVIKVNDCWHKITIEPVKSLKEVDHPLYCDELLNKGGM